MAAQRVPMICLQYTVVGLLGDIYLKRTKFSRFLGGFGLFLKDLGVHPRQLPGDSRTGNDKYIPKITG